SRLGKAIGLVRETEELLDASGPDRVSAPSPEAASGLVTKIVGLCAKLEAQVPDSTPVFMVRNAELWARLAPLGERKTVIIENADRMLESSRNALLKILEEPPESVRFVLLSSRRISMMATILSRSRSYSFKRRDKEETALILERVFRSSEPASSVDSFLAARRPFPPVQARALAEEFLSAAIAERRDGRSLPAPISELARGAVAEGRSSALSLSRLLEGTKDFGAKDERYASSFLAFLDALAQRLADLTREEALGAEGIALVAEWAGALRTARGDFESWNRNPSLLAESLLYEIGGRR
ncbi:MAG TPA: hypothetical protein VMC79_03020, partial [Rectinemataceae bacterium]|nr:hypothetical protein [Rectinemataceae bacterium]